MSARRRQAQKTARGDTPRPKASRLKLWLARGIVMIAAPALLLALLEIVLRLTGFGYSTAFLLKESSGAGTHYTQNIRFGWRFFGPRMARTPQPIWIPERKGANTIRVFVFGESAAYGDPQPRYGLARMIEAMLEARFPTRRFEVINAAMTGINSHVILPIARDCAKADGDIWVVYMGNNEVVGPFGAGTVFGPQTPPLPLVRASLALKSTRIGQALDGIRENLQKPPPGKGEWGGMTMFLDNQVAADDPRMGRVYRNFESNLRDILEAGQDSGANIVLSTVAVNLRDAAPFASKQARLDGTKLAEFNQLIESGSRALNEGRQAEALEKFRAALKLHDAVAELHYRAGIAAMQADPNEARDHLSAARDLDTLRFRCDSRLNEITRRIAAKGAQGIALADAEQAFAAESAHGAPGRELFYEHVHLTFEGNYLLARTIVPQIERLLPPRVREQQEIADWPTVQQCAARLGWSDWSRHMAVSEMLTRLSDPPFNRQSSVAAESRRMAGELERLAPPPERLAAALTSTESALERAPNDGWLWLQAATLRLQRGDIPGAVKAAERTVALWPANPEGWSQLGLALAQQEKFESAADAFRRAFALEPNDVFALQNVAQALVRMNRREEAIAEYERAVRIKPAFGTGWLALGQLHEAAGRAREAEECYQKALRHRIRRGADLAMLARFCQAKGWLDAAATNFADAVMLSPGDAVLRVEAGQNLEKLGRRGEALPYYGDAVRLSPNHVTARFLYGLALGREGDAEEAVEQFRAAVRIMPELVEARLNLAMGLMNLGKLDEAAKEFEEVLRRQPDNAIAKESLHAIAPGRN